MIKIRLYAEILGLIGLITMITLLFVSPIWFWVGAIMMLPNTLIKIREFKNLKK